ncbi:putative ankyrin repeat protein RF_0381 [Microplitis demolitor]|uniref:putative ankyrin repeat protein RF_0381 n=1 Tax=Microplitis demolitor TaxID=69319 RepID=UPI0004CDBB3F|nr:putative ankyrin repeat protein RF_0381 [Microplitis demolitor]
MSSVKILPFSLIYQQIRENILQGSMSVNTRYPGDSDENPSILQLAITKNDICLINYLLKHKVDLNATSKCFEPALHLAIRLDSYELVRKLVEAGADVNVKQKFTDKLFRYTTIYPAVSEEIKKVIELLLEDKNNDNISLGEKGFFIAMGNENFNPYDRVLDSGVDNLPVGDVVSPLHLAIQQNNYQIIEYLIANGADVDANCNGATPLYVAVDKKYKDVIKLLIKNNAKVNVETRPKSLIHLLNWSSSFKIADILLDAGADIDQDVDGTPLHHAIVSKLESMVEYLINNGADVNLKSNGMSCLHTALKSPNDKIINYLLMAGADVNVLNEKDTKVLDSTSSIFIGTPLKKSIKQHIVKLKAADFYLVRCNLEAVERDFDDYYRDCCREVDSLKQKKIPETHLSYYDVLRKNNFKLALALKNCRINFTNTVLESTFPLYGKIVGFKLYRAMKTKEYLNTASELLYNVFYGKLPDVVVREIAEYFSLSNLRMMSL